ncbi:MAG: hypothetical protein ABJP45_18935 [Cyclobacteriaceae bacterium]
MKYLPLIVISITCLLGCTQQVSEEEIDHQQDADVEYEPNAFLPKYPDGNSPTVYVDEAHYNFHTIEGRYRPFAKLLEQDGYTVKPFRDKFTNESLLGIEILLVASAFADSANWTLPTKSAFTDEEIEAVNQWVTNGGSLFLIADHMPAAGAAAKLAISFDLNFVNGYLYNAKSFSDIDIFRKNDESLSDVPLTSGIDSIATFTGQAFAIPRNAQSIINVGENFVIFLPSEIGKIHGSKTPKFYAKGLSQGAILEYGEGRIAVFGEAGMFTAQVSGDEKFKMGMNNENASQNFQLLLNTVHWLDEGLFF